VSVSLDAPLQSLGDRAQNLVAGSLAETVVDVFEVVEIEEEHGYRRLAAPRPRQRLRHPVLKERAVGQIGQRVVKSLMRKLRLEGFPLVDVARRHHDAGDVRVEQKIGGDALDVPPRAIGQGQAPLDGRGFVGRPAGVLQEPIQVPGIVCMGDIG